MVGMEPSQPFLGTTLGADISRQPVRDVRGVFRLKNEMCYMDWSSYLAMICGLVMGFGRGGHGAAPAGRLCARWAELPKMLGSVQISAQVFEPYLAVANKLAVLQTSRELGLLTAVQGLLSFSTWGIHFRRGIKLFLATLWPPFLFWSG